MKVSLNTIRQFIDFALPPVDELVQRINSQLGGVEEVIDLGEKYKDAIIVRVVECEKHANADKLSVCMIDAGDRFKELRSENQKLIKVVCGAPNVHAGMWAIWLPPGATVPASFDDKSPFVLDVREIRGVNSNGMLAAADELAIGTDHAGIIELTDDDLPPASSIEHLASGLCFAEAFGLDDTIIDIENKMFTHRPDLFGQLGVAREIAGILGHQFSSPKWYVREGLKRESIRAKDDLALKVENNAGKAVPRFMAVVIDNVEVKPSPLWLQCELVRLGSKPINNIVDVTNYVMLLTAQPTHAYDYDKLHGHTLGTRMAKKGEIVKLLNGKTYELDQTDVVIVDGQGPVGLGGIMGGGNSEVSKSTTRIVLEVANFDMYTVRRSSMRHGLFTDALTRFTKGQSPLQNPVVLNLLMTSLIEAADGAQASDIFDRQAIDDRRWTIGIEIDNEFINNRLGLHLESDQINTLLKNVEIDVQRPMSNVQCLIKPPFWRTDLEQPEDIVEEVGRLYGFDKLPRELPRRTTKAAPINARREIKNLIRESMQRAGANEVLTYSFANEKVMQRAEQDSSQAFKLSNALSPDLQYYRLSVLPSLLDKIHMNVKAGHDEFVLYEIGKGHNKKYHASDDEGLPRELEFVDAVYASKSSRDGAAYYHVSRLMSQLARDLGFAALYKPADTSLDYPVTAPFDLARSAMVETTDGIFIGMIGELKQTVIKSFKLPAYCSAMTLDLDGLLQAHEKHSRSYMPLSKYPSITQDISLKVDADCNYQELFAVIEQTLQKNGSNYHIGLSPLSIYQDKNTSDKKTVTLRCKVTSYDKTLTDKVVSKLLEGAATAANKTCGAVVV